MNERISVRLRDGYWTVRSSDSIGFFQDWPAALAWANTLREKEKRMAWKEQDGLVAWRPGCACGNDRLPGLRHDPDGCVELRPREIEVPG